MRQRGTDQQRPGGLCHVPEGGTARRRLRCRRRTATTVTEGISGQDEVGDEPARPGPRDGQQEFGPALDLLRTEPQHRLDARCRSQDPGDAQQRGGEHIDDLGPAARDEPADEFLQRLVPGHRIAHHGPEAAGQGSQDGGADAPADQVGRCSRQARPRNEVPAGTGALPAGPLGQQAPPRSRRLRTTSTATARTAAAAARTSSGTGSGSEKGRERWPQPIGESSEAHPL